MSEPRESRRIWWITAAVLVALVASRFLPKLGNPLAPKPVAAYVAILAEGDDAAADGMRDLAAGRPFRLYAVLEARDWRGRELWFSEAQALRIGDRDIPAAALRLWPEDPRVKVRWFTVEGAAPYLEVKNEADLDRFRAADEFHPEWGDRWSVPGVVDPKLVFLADASPLRPLPFGTQRYAVRIEFFHASNALTPETRVASPAAGEALESPQRVSGVEVSLPPPLAVLSASFGRQEIELGPEAGAAAEERVRRLESSGLAFERADLLRRHLEASGTPPDDLTWREIDVATERLDWQRDVAAGDLLQAGPRLVVLFRDAGEPGRLDPGDLVFDLWKGLHARRLDEIFRGAGEMRVDLARLSRPAAELPTSPPPP